jgi:signal transduction histidine kinase
VAALEFGKMPMGGATGAVLKRALASLTQLVDQSISEVKSEVPGQRHIVSVASLIADAETAGQLAARAMGCSFAVAAVDPDLVVRANRSLLLTALANLLQNAFKFTHAHTEVTLKAYAFGEEVLIEVSDHCGGLPAGSAEKLFTPFSQRSEDKSGLGLGLSIARQSVQADAGTLSVRDMPGIGCVFTIALPRYALQ